MLGAFGATLTITADDGRGRFIEIDGGQKLRGCDVDVPGDPSSAAFIAAAAVITERSDVTIRNVLMNPTRSGFFETLREMGADIAYENKRELCGEPVCDLRVRHSVLHGVETPAERAPSMIDEYPILAIVAAFANGQTRMTGIHELRVKESDRIAAVERGLIACGVDVESGEDWLRVKGSTNGVPGGARIRTDHDHRIAMSFLVLGLASKDPVEIDDASMIATSFPDFVAMMQRLGAHLSGDDI